MTHANPGWAANIIHTCMGVQPGEKVLIAVDEPLGFVRDALQAEALKAEPAELWTYTIPDVTRPISAYPPRFEEMVRQMDVAVRFMATVDPVKEGSAHMPILGAVRESRVRYGFGSYIDQDILENELSADYQAIADLTLALVGWLDGRSSVHITTPLGTDLRLSVAGRAWQSDTGLIRGQGVFGNLPAGEVYVAPIEDSAEGILVVDKSLPGFPLSEPVRLVFEKGRVVHIEGGAGAAHLQELITEAEHKQNGEWARVIGELGIGTNSQARLLGNLMTDEKVAGTIHIAIGRNVLFGGQNLAPIHEDGVVGQPTMRVDGELLIDRGNYLLDRPGVSEDASV
ncbi:MAG: aminopeptidase [Anaerolineae bacterium]